MTTHDLPDGVTAEAVLATFPPETVALGVLIAQGAADGLPDGWVATPRFHTVGLDYRDGLSYAHATKVGTGWNVALKRTEMVVASFVDDTAPTIAEALRSTLQQRAAELTVSGVAVEDLPEWAAPFVAVHA